MPQRPKYINTNYGPFIPLNLESKAVLKWLTFQAIVS